jgi:hypothetical protein
METVNRVLTPETVADEVLRHLGEVARVDFAAAR